MSKKVIVGMSGGVDSAVAAYLLQQQGYQVAGMFMKNWEEEDPNSAYCSAQIDMQDAQQVCDDLEIPLYKVNFAKQYWDRVFSHFLSEYESGRTPNPDIICNKEIKFKAFLNYALKLGADYIATGHYVRTTKNGKLNLLKGIDPNKDQSYFLHSVASSELEKALFPIGDLHKSQVRQLAMEMGFINHDKKDSTGICFIGERRFKDFLNQYLAANEGAIKTANGTEIGRHSGLIHYTIGQRQGIGIGGMQNQSCEPWYVVAKNLAANELIVAQGKQNPLLFHKFLTAKNLCWINSAPTAPFLCSAKIRYRQADQECSITQIDHTTGRVEFTTAQRAITPGQSIVFYQGDKCLGGGIIQTAYN